MSINVFGTLAVMGVAGAIFAYCSKCDDGIIKNDCGIFSRCKACTRNKSKGFFANKQKCNPIEYYYCDCRKGR